MSPANVDGWSAVVNDSVGLSGSCVVIPCTFSYPANGRTYTEFTGIWYKGRYESTVYDRDTSKISDAFKGRTSLIGDLRKNDCSLKISSLSSSDTGPFMFRIEIKDLGKYTYEENKVSITVKGKRYFFNRKVLMLTFTLKNKGSKRVLLFCSVSFQFLKSISVNLFYK